MAALGRHRRVELIRIPASSLRGAGGDEAIQLDPPDFLDCFASLAMTKQEMTAVP
jgi:hypothetical protein